MAEPEIHSTSRSVARSQPAIVYERVKRLFGRTGPRNACPSDSRSPGTLRAEGCTEPSGFLTMSPIAPALGRSPATLSSAASVPPVISASGFSNRTKGAAVDPIPWFAAAANPRFTGFSMIRAAGCCPAAR
jgi:hypothetical protein